MPVGKIHEKGKTSFSEILEDFKERLGDEVGAIGSFIGIVRKDAKKGGKIKRLHYEGRKNAAKSLEKIATSIENEIEGISKVDIHHFVDDLKPGDDIVYVIVGGAHRKEVFAALPKIMNRVKTEVHIWKKEITENEEYWLHEVEE